MTDDPSTDTAPRGLPAGEERVSVRDELADFYRAGSTLLELSSRTGRSYWAVRTLLLEAGVQLRRPGGYNGGCRARNAA